MRILILFLIIHLSVVLNNCNMFNTTEFNIK